MARCKRNHSQPVRTGAGGELHQLPGEGGVALTTNEGVIIADDQNSLKANPRGPTLLEDFILREKITHLDLERIPEGIMHARGSGAHGFFELTQSLSEYTKIRFSAAARRKDAGLRAVFEKDADDTSDVVADPYPAEALERDLQTHDRRPN